MRAGGRAVSSTTRGLNETVSASREKKTRQDEVAQGPTSREQKRQQEAKEARRSTILYTVVGVVCAVLAVAVIVWNSGVLARTMTAVTINGEKYTAVDVQYYFNTTRSNLLTYYYKYMGTTPFDYTTSTKDQVYNEESGQTWYDYLMEQTMVTMRRNAALADKAEAEGYTMSQTAQDSLNSTLKDLETAWVGRYSSRDSYLRASYGPYLSYNHYVELLTRDMLADDYAQNHYDNISYTDEDYETYYQENADALDTYTVSQFIFRANVPTTDEDGNAIEMTDEEKAALEQKAEESKPVLDFLKETLGGAIKEARVSKILKSGAVCLTADGPITLEMEKYFQKVDPENAGNMKAQRVLELNPDSAAFAALSRAVESDRDKAARYAKLLYAQAQLIAGLPLEDPAGYTELVCSLMN